MTYLNTLIDELAAISAEEIAAALSTTDPAEDEIVLGVASRDLQALFALRDKTINERVALVETIKRDHDDLTLRQLNDMHGDINRLRKKEKTLNFLFWQSVELEYPAPKEAMGMGFRAGGEIVSMHQNESEPGDAGDGLMGLLELFGGRRIVVDTGGRFRGQRLTG